MHVRPQLDLNLLVLFDALVTTRQVTTAAEKVGLSQSAASHALRRLRDSVGDPLLVRGAHGLVLTPRGEALARGVRSSLATLGHALSEHRTFDPATSERSFRIAAADGFDIVVLPALLAQLARHASGITLGLVRPPERDIAGALESGSIDLYYGVLPNLPAFQGLLPDPGVSSLMNAPVYEEGWVCLVRCGHPRIQGNPRLKRYAGERHVLFSPTGAGAGIVDRLLEREGLTRTIALRVSSFHSALECVRRTDCIWTGPRRIAGELDPKRELLHLKPPLALPTYRPRLVWHERFDQDPAHRWFRQAVVRAGGACARSR